MLVSEYNIGSPGQHVVVEFQASKSLLQVTPTQSIPLFYLHLPYKPYKPYFT